MNVNLKALIGKLNAETREQLGGYYVIETDTLDQALEWAARMPAIGVEAGGDAARVWQSMRRQHEHVTLKRAKSGVQKRCEARTGLRKAPVIQTGMFVAQETLDNRTAPPVVGVAELAQGSRQSILRQHHAITSGILFVLHQQLGKAAYR